MKKLTVAFLIGALLGGSVVLSFFYIARDQMLTESEQAVQTLDYVVDEWSRSRIPSDTVALAQIKKPEFGFRLRHIPDTVHALAERVERLYRVPKGSVIAQWILESRYGLSDLGANAFFGHTLGAVRHFMQTPDSVLRREKIVRNGTLVSGRAVWFARYKNMAESFDVHGIYLSRSKRYASAFDAGSSEQFVRELARAGYAEDPEYALKLIAIMKRHRL